MQLYCILIVLMLVHAVRLAPAVKRSTKNISSASLNVAQRAAVTSSLNAAALCVAGPGSGKTKVLTHRIEYLIDTCKQDPSSIVAITFTNKAAMEMRKRLSLLLGEEVSKRLTIGTFHSFGSRLLRTVGKDHLPVLTQCTLVDKQFTIYDQDDCLKLVKELMNEQNISQDVVRPASVLAAINNLREAEAMALSGAAAEGVYKETQSSLTKATRVAKIMTCDFCTRLHSSNALDFQDLLLLSYKLLRLDAAQRVILNRWRHILVDEWQDTNVPQYEVVRLLAPNALLSSGAAVPGASEEIKGKGNEEQGISNGRSLFAVGDKNQAIYSWRGARPTNMQALSKDYPFLESFGLLENYRSTSSITSVANALLGVVGTMPMSKDAAPEPVRIITCADEEEEAQCVVKILSTLNKASANPRTIAIMYRTNAQSRVIEQVLVEKGISYKLMGGRRFYDRKEIRDTLCLLRMLVNPFDREAVQRAMGELGKGIGPATRDTFFAWCEQSATEAAAQNLSPPGYLAHLFAMIGNDRPANEMGVPAAFSQFSAGIGSVSECTLTKREENSLMAFADLIKEIFDGAQTLTLSVLVSKVLDRFITKEYLLKISKGKDEAEERAENVNELIKATQKYAKMKGGAMPSGALVDFIEEAALLSGGEEEEAAAEGEEEKIRECPVSLCTIHASKGLEFHTVFVLGNEDGCLPITKTIEDKEINYNPLDDTPTIAEERRLAFVAVTRAEKLLFLTTRRRAMIMGKSENGQSGVKWVNTKPSRFLRPLEALEKGETRRVISLVWNAKE